MINDNKKVLQIKGSYNNLYDSDELLWLLKGNENITAKEFICKKVLNIEPENLMDVFEYVN